MKGREPDLSLIIPCYNEEQILLHSYKEIKDVLDRTTLGYEIIFVDDFSRDRTVELIHGIMKTDDTVKLIRHERNMGRGQAVEDGVKAACGRIAGFLDIDLQVPAHYVLPLMIALDQGADIATAQRIYDMKFHMLHRFVLSKGYHFLFDKALKTGIKDSEVGYKFFKREKILPVLAEIRDKHWFWDTEIMVRSHLKGFVINEVPCLCIREEDQKSTVNMFKDIADYLGNLWKFKREVDGIRKSRRPESASAKKEPNVLYSLLNSPAVFNPFSRYFGDQGVVERVIRDELRIQGDERILDLGCGTGNLSRMFPSKRYVGVDLDGNYIDFARRTYGRDFMVMDASELKFDDGSFDLIFTKDIFHHLEDGLFRKVLSEMRRALKSDAKALIVEISYRLSDDLLYKKVLRRLDRGRYIREFGVLREAIGSYFTIHKEYIRKGAWGDLAVFLVSK